MLVLVNESMKKKSLCWIEKQYQYPRLLEAGFLEQTVWG
jgi:hypothetical protein